MCGSSSTTRMLSGFDSPAGTGAASGRAARAPIGSSSVKVAPAPGRVSRVMRPPCSFMMPWQMESPSPVPSPSRLVVKNGSKTGAASSSCARGPESVALPLLAAREGEQVLDDRRGALGLLADDLKRLLERGRDVARLGEEVAEANDGGQGIVQVVRHAGDQLTDRRHFLRLYELLLQPAPLRLVLEHEDRGARLRHASAGQQQPAPPD